MGLGLKVGSSRKKVVGVTKSVVDTGATKRGRTWRHKKLMLMHLNHTTNTTPTRGWGTDEPSILDLLYTSRNESVDSIDFHAPFGKSDHSVIKIMYMSAAEQITDKISYDYVKANYEKMKRMLDIFNDCQDDIDLMWGSFVDKECIPKESLTQKQSSLVHSIDIRYQEGKRSIDCGNVILNLKPMYRWDILSVEIK